MPFNQYIHSNHMYLLEKKENRIFLDVAIDVEHTKSVFTHQYLHRFRSGFRSISVMWTAKNDFEADPFYFR